MKKSVMAERQLVVRLKGRESAVLVQIRKPKEHKKNAMFSCRFRIKGLPGHRDDWIRIHGVDSLDAVLTAIHIIHVHLYYRLHPEKTRLTWFGTRDVGVPLTAGPFTNNRDAKGRVRRLREKH